MMYFIYCYHLTILCVVYTREINEGLNRMEDLGRGVPIISSADVSILHFLPISVLVQNNRRIDIATDIYTAVIIYM